MGLARKCELSQAMMTWKWSSEMQCIPHYSTRWNEFAASSFGASDICCLCSYHQIIGVAPDVRWYNVIQWSKFAPSVSSWPRQSMVQVGHTIFTSSLLWCVCVSCCENNFTYLLNHKTENLQGVELVVQLHWVLDMHFLKSRVQLMSWCRICASESFYGSVFFGGVAS